MRATGNAASAATGRDAASPSTKPVTSGSAAWRAAGLGPPLRLCAAVMHASHGGWRVMATSSRPRRRPLSAAQRRTAVLQRYGC